MKLEKGAVIVECESIDFCGKDIIRVKHQHDFRWLVGSGTAFKLGNSYYSISSDVAYVWVDQLEKV